MVSGTNVIIQIQDGGQYREYFPPLMVVRSVIQNGLGCFGRPVVLVYADTIPQPAMMSYDIPDERNCY